MNTDRELRHRVQIELAQHPSIDIKCVQVEVHDGVVSLTGTVDSLGTASLASRAVMRVDGAHAVVNELSVGSHGERRDRRHHVHRFPAASAGRAYSAVAS